MQTCGCSQEEVEVKYRIITCKGRFIPQRKTWYGYANLIDGAFRNYPRNIQGAEQTIQKWHEDHVGFDEWMTKKVVKEIEL